MHLILEGFGKLQAIKLTDKLEISILKLSDSHTLPILSI
jgi:hypothetical protein